MFAGSKREILNIKNDNALSMGKIKEIAFIDKNSKEIIRFAQSLIRINSSYSNETAVAFLIKDKLNEYGIKSMLAGKKADRKNLIAEVKGKGKTFLLSGHLDTTTCGNEKSWKFPPYSGTISNGKLFGVGALDMKGGISSIVYSFISLAQNSELKGNVKLVLAGQEMGADHEGIREVMKDCIGAKGCIIAEPGPQNTIDIGGRGVYRFELLVKGKQAQSAYPEKGSNAIMNAVELISALKKAKFRFKKHKMFRPFAMNFDMINGGKALNIIPGECTLGVDCRLTYGQTKENILSAVKKAILKLKKKERFFDAEINELAYIRPYYVNKNDKTVRLAVKSCEYVTGNKAVLRVGGAACDGNLLAEKGIPNVTFGPVGGNVLSENEFVYTKSLVDAAKIYALTTKEFLK